MKKKMLKIALAVCAAATTLPSLAAGPAGSGPNPYTDCGIGAALFKDTHWAAVTSNVIWDLGSTAITSATASPETCTNKSVKAAMFVRDTYAQIIEDAARGHGEHLTAVLEIFECTAHQKDEAGNSVRNAVGAAVAQPDFGSRESLERAGQLYQIIDSAARHHCAA